MPFPNWDNPPLPGGYSSKLVGLDLNAWRGLQLTPQGSGVSPDLGKKSIESAVLLAGHLMQGVAARSGWVGPLIPLDELTDMAQLVAAALDPDADPLDIIAAVTKLVGESDLLRTALEPTLEAVQDALTNALVGVAPVLEIVPYVGWVVSIVRAIVQGVKQLREPFVIDVPGGFVPDTIQGWPPGIIPNFNKERDDTDANRALAILQTGDWTNIWMPSTINWGALALDYAGKGRIDGWYFGPMAGAADEIAAMPGSAQLCNAFYGQFGKNGIITRSYSDVLPSVNQLAGLAWTNLFESTGQCCNVDLQKLRTAWSTWNTRGRQYSESLEVDPNEDVDNAYRVGALRTMILGALGVTYDWGNDYQIIRTDLYPKTPKYLASDSRRGTNSHGVVDRVNEALDSLRLQIYRNLGTIACAYVPPSAPALRDPELKIRYAAMRMALLKHSARWSVERDLVPDEPYRKMLFDSTVGGTLVAPGIPYKPRGTIDGGPEPSPPRLPGVPGGEFAGPNGGGGGGLLLAGAGLVALLFLVRKFLGGRR